MLASHESDKHMQSLAGIMKARRQVKKEIKLSLHIEKSKSWKQSCKNQFAKIERWFWSVILQGKAHICDLSKQQNEETH